MLKRGRYKDSTTDFVRRHSVQKARHENRSVFWVVETEFLALLEPEDEGITTLLNGGNCLSDKALTCHWTCIFRNNCVGTSDLQTVELKLIFQRFNIRRGFTLRHCEHAELKWFRVLSSSGFSYRRCWIIKCGFCYTRQLADDFSELVRATTKCLLFYIHDALCARARVLVNLHTT
jgi:hypothetical protein